MSAAAAKLAVYVSNHGLGHFVRTAAVCARLAERRPVTFTVVSAGPHELWPERIAAGTRWRCMAPDPGVVVRDGIDVDTAASQRAVARWQAGFAAAVEQEARWLASQRPDLVLGDVPALAFAAARCAGVPSVALANFSWDWVYECMGWRSAAEVSAAAYAEADLLLELEPCAPMPAFRNRSRLGLLGRRACEDRHFLRRRLGLEPQQRLALIGLSPACNQWLRLPAVVHDVFYLLDGEVPSRPDARSLPADFTFAEAIAAADVVLAKPGYGTVGDTAASGTSMLWTRREGFPEDRVLEPWISAHLVARRVERSRLREGDWGEPLLELFDRRRGDPHPIPALEAACMEIDRLLGA